MNVPSVMSTFLLSQAAERGADTEKKPAGKKESADSSGSSLLEFAFQSALFGNTLFGDKEASPAPPQGWNAVPRSTGPCYIPLNTSRHQVQIRFEFET